jgi:hypothetical protein
MSTRRCITDAAKEKIDNFYKQLLDLEKSQCFDASKNAFYQFLEKNNLHDSVAFNSYMKQLNK